MTIPAADYDGAWKAALELYLPNCLALLTPTIHDAIAWEQGVRFLDKELQAVAPAEGNRPITVDKLVSVHLAQDGEVWILIHIEAQHHRDDQFAERMFSYYTRLVDRFKQSVVSLAILGDDEPGWRPQRFERELLGCSVRFEFPIVKLIDFQDRLPGLEANRNPFATVVLAHLAALVTRRDTDRRLTVKLSLVRRLYTLGYEREEVISLFRLIDWLLRLPPTLEETVWQAVQAIEEAQQMSYITSVERIGMERGRQEGFLAGLSLALEVKFGAEGRAFAERLGHISEPALLEQVGEKLRVGATLDELRALVALTES